MPNGECLKFISILNPFLRDHSNFNTFNCIIEILLLWKIKFQIIEHLLVYIIEILFYLPRTLVVCENEKKKTFLVICYLLYLILLSATFYLLCSVIRYFLSDVLHCFQIESFNRLHPRHAHHNVLAPHLWKGISLVNLSGV